MMRLAILPSVIVLAAVPALAQTVPPDFPSRRAGHWQIVMTTKTPAGSSSVTVQVCTNAEAERLMMQKALGMAGEACQRHEIRRIGEEVHFDSDCRVGAMRNIVQAVMSGDFTSSYTVRMQGRVEMDGQPPTDDVSSVQQGTWLSETCSGGLVPGDMQVEGGPAINVRDMPQPGAPGAQPQAPKR